MGIKQNHSVWKGGVKGENKICEHKMFTNTIFQNYVCELPPN